mmetsp:Transcript_37848/g.56275  ORF Transcript_37848/g.56275 Transcript_37848/m.56275 type:complete len:116 (-) Transcript_37848:59-406(-)
MRYFRKPGLSTWTDSNTKNNKDVTKADDDERLNVLGLVAVFSPDTLSQMSLPTMVVSCELWSRFFRGDKKQPVSSLFCRITFSYRSVDAQSCYSWTSKIAGNERNESKKLVRCNK